MRISLIGAGAIGGAMLKAWLNAKTAAPGDIAVFDPAPSDDIRALAARTGVQLNPEIDAFTADVVVFAVKPQLARDVLPAYASFVRNAVVLSIMAGFSCASLREIFGEVALARGMPNLAVQVGVGVTGLYADAGLDADARAHVDAVIAPTGRGVWVENEPALDALTAVSGSGPAYFFLLAEALAEAGAKLGLPAETARTLAEATLSGAGALMAADPRSAADLRVAVTSPGGVTAEALAVFDRTKDGFRPLAEEALKAGAARAAALAT